MSLLRKKNYPKFECGISEMKKLKSINDSLTGYDDDLDRDLCGLGGK